MPSWTRIYSKRKTPYWSLSIILQLALNTALSDVTPFPKLQFQVDTANAVPYVPLIFYLLYSPSSRKATSSLADAVAQLALNDAAY